MKQTKRTLKFNLAQVQHVRDQPQSISGEFSRRTPVQVVTP